MNNWTIYVLSDGGKPLPHWTEASRERAREKMRVLRKSYPDRKWRLRREGLFSPPEWVR